MKPPPLGYIKFNTDGAIFPKSGFVSAAIVARDDVGRWLEGVRRNIDKCNVE